MIRREEIIGDQRLILGDCLSVLPTLGPVDAVVTDPPYGVLAESWDDMETAELAAFTMAWSGMARRLADDAVVFFGERTRSVVAPILSMLFAENRQIIWSKGGGSAAADGMFYSYESAYLCRSAPISQTIVGPKSTALAEAIREARQTAGLSKGGVDIAVRGKKTGLCYRWEEACCIPTDEQVKLLSGVMHLGERFFSALDAAKRERDVNLEANAQRTKDAAAKRLDVLRYPSPKGIGHPTSKPVGLMVDMIEAVGGETILDPFMGSGTTLVACAKLGRRGIGIEISEESFEIACERVRKAYAQPDMFIERPAAPVQEKLW